MKARLSAIVLGLVAALASPMMAEAQSPSAAEDIQALNEALALLLRSPESDEAPRNPADADVVVRLSASNRVWTADGRQLVDGVLSLPTGEVIVLQVMAMDLIHDMTFDDLGLEFEAIPGRIELVWIEFHQEGRFVGRCRFSCGSMGAPLVFDVRDAPQSD